MHSHHHPSPDSDNSVSKPDELLEVSELEWDSPSLSSRSELFPLLMSMSSESDAQESSIKSIASDSEPKSSSLSH